MAIKTKKINVKQLAKGMYVSKLDRPWIETSYPIEGFYIKTDEEIRDLKAQCKYIFIDVDLSKLHLDLSHIDLGGTDSSQKQDFEMIMPTYRGKSEDKPQTTITIKEPTLKKPLYLERIPFEKEYKNAKQLFDDLTDTAFELLQGIAEGKPFDSGVVNEMAVDMVNTMIRNPDTFLWLSRLKVKDSHSHDRAIRSAIWAISFGRHLSLEKEELTELSSAVLLSQIGKVQLPQSILQKPGPLTKEDAKVYRLHVNYSVHLLEKMGHFSPNLITTITQHCERYDGSGYPKQLKNEQISLHAQIAGLVTYYDQITHHRDDRKSLDSTRAMEHLFKLRNVKFDAHLIEEFIQSIGIYPAGSLIQLNSKEVAVIIEQNDQHRLLPKVMILRDHNKQSVNTFKILDLAKLSKTSKVAPKIINSLPLGTCGISSEEVMNSFKRTETKGFLKKIFA